MCHKIMLSPKLPVGKHVASCKQIKKLHPRQCRVWMFLVCDVGMYMKKRNELVFVGF